MTKNDRIGTIWAMLVITLPAPHARAEESCPNGRHPLGYCLDAPTVKGRIRQAPQRVSLESYPPGAKVYVNGKPLQDASGQSNLTTPLPSLRQQVPGGVAVFEFEKSGFVKQRKQLTILPHGTQRVCALLEPLHQVKLQSNVDCLLKIETARPQADKSKAERSSSGAATAPLMVPGLVEVRGGELTEVPLEPGDYKLSCSAKNYTDSVVTLSLAPLRSGKSAQSDCSILDSEMKSQNELGGPLSAAAKAQEPPIRQFTLVPIPVSIEIDSDVADIPLVFSKVESEKADCQTTIGKHARVTLEQRKGRLHLLDGVGWYCVNAEHQYETPLSAAMFSSEQLELLKTAPTHVMRLAQKVFVPSDGFKASLNWRDDHHPPPVSVTERTSDEFKTDVASCWQGRPIECPLAPCWSDNANACHTAAALVLLSRPSAIARRSTGADGPKPMVGPLAIDYPKIADSLIRDHREDLGRVRAGLQKDDFKAFEPLGVEGLMFAASCRRGFGVACEALGAMLHEQAERKQAEQKQAATKAADSPVRAGAPPKPTADGNAPRAFFTLACLQGSESACLRAFDPTGWPSATAMFELAEGTRAEESSEEHWWYQRKKFEELGKKGPRLQAHVAGVPWSTDSQQPFLAALGLSTSEFQRGKWFGASVRLLAPLLITYEQTDIATNTRRTRYVFGLDAAAVDFRLHPFGGPLFLGGGITFESRFYDTGTKRPALFNYPLHVGLGTHMRGWSVSVGARLESLRTKVATISGTTLHSDDWVLMPFVTLESDRLWGE